MRIKGQSVRLVIVMAICMLQSAVSQADTNNDVTTMARRIYLTPEALTVAQLQDSATAILQRINDAAEERHLVQLQLVEVNGREAAVADLCVQISALPEDSDTLAGEIASAKDQLQLANNLLLERLDDLRQLAVEGIPVEKVQILDQCRVAFQYKVPIEFSVRLQNEAEWRAIEAAVRAETRAVRLEQELEQEYSTLLQELRTDMHVIAAQQSLLIQLPIIEQAFLSFGQ